jgi:hypothetical protein
MNHERIVQDRGNESQCGVVIDNHYPEDDASQSS